MYSLRVSGVFGGLKHAVLAVRWVGVLEMSHGGALTCCVECPGGPVLAPLGQRQHHDWFHRTCSRTLFHANGL